MTPQHIHDIAGFIATELLSEIEQPLSQESLLIESGLIDSFGIVEIVSFIEEKFGVSLENDDLVIENFNTISAIAGLVSRKTKST